MISIAILLLISMKINNNDNNNDNNNSNQCYYDITCALPCYVIKYTIDSMDVMNI